MENYNIKTATAIYTGGGIYIYYGQLENGLYFRACDDWDCISICNADTGNYNDDGSCDADYPEFYDEHEINTIYGYQFEEFFNDMILWIMHEKPDGNYNVDELEKRMFAHVTTTIEIENAQMMEKAIQERVKQEKFEKMLKHQISSIESCMSEFRNDCKFFFADGSQYGRDFEKQWKEEFYSSAVRLFEQKGYRIVKHGNYTLIKW